MALFTNSRSEPENEKQAREGKGEHDKDHRAAMRLDELGQLRVHLPASEILT